MSVLHALFIVKLNAHSIIRIYFDISLYWASSSPSTS